MKDIKKKEFWYGIEKFSLLYAILKPYFRFFHKAYYKEFKVIGKENIPYDCPVIFAINHQNALMDALAILFTVKGQPIFLARADIFKKYFLAKVLKFMNIMPVYRIRDGYESLQNNNEVFDKIIEVIEKGHKIAILPEGSHKGIRRLRPLKKGICRIAFTAEEKNNFKLNLKIVPVGIDYSNYTKFNQSVLISYGMPISLSDFYEIYKENPQKAYNELLNTISDRLRQLIVNINNDEYYELYDNVREIYKEKIKEKLNFKNLKQPNKFICDKILIEAIDKELSENNERVNDLNIKVREYVDYLNKKNFRNWLFNKDHYSLILIFIQLLFHLTTLPFFVYGVINNILPYYLPIRAIKNVKDPQFHSSFKSVIASLTFPFFYILQSLMILIIGKNIYLALIYLISLPVSFYFSLYYYLLLKKVIAKVRYNKNNKTSEQRNIKLLREEIFNTIDRIIESRIPNINRDHFLTL